MVILKSFDICMTFNARDLKCSWYRILISWTIRRDELKTQISIPKKTLFLKSWVERLEIQAVEIILTGPNISSYFFHNTSDIEYAFFRKTSLGDQSRTENDPKPGQNDPKFTSFLVTTIMKNSWKAP